MEPYIIPDKHPEVEYLHDITNYKSPLIEDFIEDIGEEAERAFGDRVFKLLEDKRIQEDVTNLIQIGEGSYAKVFTANNKAYKRISLIIDDYYDPSNALREIFVLSRLYHKNVIDMMSFSINEDMVYIATHKAVSDLTTLLYAGVPAYTEEQWTNVYINGEQRNVTFKISLMMDLIEGLNYIHSKGFIHRDIKPANLIIMSDGRLCIGDLGSASERIYADTKTIVVAGTYRYLDISTLQQTYYVSYDIFTDLWSAACVLLEMLVLLPLITQTALELHVLSSFSEKGFNRFESLIRKR